MYTSYFGFSQPPFRDSTSRILLTYPSYRAIYALLHKKLAEGHGLLMLTGLSGTGKTTLLNCLMTELKDRMHFTFIWHAQLSFDDVLSYLCDDLGLHSVDIEPDLKIRDLETCLRDRLIKGKAVVLIMDDAHQLSGQTLEGLHRLVQLKERGRPLLQVVLSGLPVLKAQLAKMPALDQYLGGHGHLNTLDEDEAARYIGHHLQAAGRNSEDLFEVDALRAIVAHAGGVPGLINLICKQALLLAYLNSEECISAERIQEMVADGQLAEMPSVSMSPLESIPAFTPLEPTGISLNGLESRIEEESVTSSAIKTESEWSVIPAPQSNDTFPPLGIITYLSRYSQRHSLFLSGLLLILLVPGAVLAVRYLNSSLQLDQPLGLGETISQEAIPADSEAPADSKPPPTEVDIPLVSSVIGDNGSAATAKPSPVSPSLDTSSVQKINASRKHPSATSRLTKAKHIQTLLDQANQQMAALRYTRPLGKNALHSYRQVLQLDPNNFDALRGIKYIKYSFVRWADSSQARGDLAKAQRQLEIALSIDSNDKTIQARLNWIRQEQIERTIFGGQRYQGQRYRKSEKGWVNRD